VRVRPRSIAPPIYPGDLVVREDKGVVSDAVRRFASDATHSTDLAIRLKDHPDEPVALPIAGARGLGDAAVLLDREAVNARSRRATVDRIAPRLCP